MRISELFASFRKLPVDEQRLFISASIWLPVVYAALKLFGLAAVLRNLIHPKIRDIRTFGAGEAGRMWEIVATAGRHSVAPSTCLTRSIVLARMLRRRGADGQIRIGVRLVGGTLHAHAWVDYEGKPINDRKDLAVEFAAFPNVMPSDAIWDR